jgi:hypothetical protein
MADSPPRRTDTEYDVEMQPSSDEDDDNRTDSEAFQDSMKLMLSFYKKLPTKAMKEFHLRTYPAFR